MKAIALGLLAVWIAGGAGREITRRLSVLDGFALERWVYSAAIGFGIAAYGMLALGLAGLFSFVPITVWWLVLLAVGLRGGIENGQEFVVSARNGFGLRQELAGASSAYRALVGFALTAFVVCGGIGIVSCFLAPNGLQWDAIAYHLADPKVFLAQHRVSSLPTEHHSNFPLTMEMLYAAGLLYGDYALANLLHFTMGVLTTAAIIAFCRRNLSNAAGWLTAIIFVTTPVVLWEATVAYVELGFGLFATLATLGVVESSQKSVDIRKDSERLLLAGVTMGFALGVKYLALIPFALLVGLLILRRVSARQIGVFVGLTVLVASPWYVKNIVVVHNPVYPFLVKVFPQSLYWNAERGAIYQAEQDSFGYPHSLSMPAAALRNLIEMPYHLLANGEKYSNAGEYSVFALIGGLYAAFGFALLFVRRIPMAVRLLAVLAVLQLAAWFFVGQISRYLVSVLPTFAVVCGYAAQRLTERSGQNRGIMMLSRAIVTMAIGGQFALLLWAAFILPTTLDVAEAGNEFLHPETVTQHLSRSLETYDATDWINRNAGANDGVVLYDETRGFYLDRPYLWGNGEHSSYIPYETLTDGAALTAWFRAHGIRYALFNLRWSPRRADPEFAAGLRGREEEALRRWYVDASEAKGWRRLVGDAIGRGLWQTRYAGKEIVVMEIMEPKRTGDVRP